MRHARVSYLGSRHPSRLTTLVLLPKMFRRTGTPSPIPPVDGVKRILTLRGGLRLEGHNFDLLRSGWSDQPVGRSSRTHDGDPETLVLTAVYPSVED